MTARIRRDAWLLLAVAVAVTCWAANAQAQPKNEGDQPGGKGAQPPGKQAEGQGGMLGGQQGVAGMGGMH